MPNSKCFLTTQKNKKQPGIDTDSAWWWSRDRKTGYAKTWYREEAKAIILCKNICDPNGP